MLRKIIFYTIKAYQQYVRAVMPYSCRFHPTCSEYARQAIEKYGVLKGGLKTIGRLLRCQPFSGQAGFDPLR